MRDNGLKEVFANLDHWATDQVPSALMGLARTYAVRGETEMRYAKPWRNRSGMAWRGLLGLALRIEDAIMVRLLHSVDYGLHLELKNSGKYAILKPTAERLAPDFLADAKRLVGKP